MRRLLWFAAAAVFPVASAGLVRLAVADGCTPSWPLCGIEITTFQPCDPNLEHAEVACGCWPLGYPPFWACTTGIGFRFEYEQALLIPRSGYSGRCHRQAQVPCTLTIFCLSQDTGAHGGQCNYSFECEPFEVPASFLNGFEAPAVEFDCDLIIG